MSIRRIFEITGWYGNDKSSETNVFVAELYNGDIWYVIEGSRNVNQSPDELEDGVWLEQVRDVNMFTADGPVNSVEEFELELESAGI